MKFFYYPGLRPPVEGFAFFSSSLGRVKASFSLHSFFRQIYIEGELPPFTFYLLPSTSYLLSSNF